MKLKRGHVLVIVIEDENQGLSTSVALNRLLKVVTIYVFAFF